MTDHSTGDLDATRLNPVARSLLGKFGEPVLIERFAGSDVEDGYADRDHLDPERHRVILRPGGIDTPFTDTLGDHGSADLWCIAPGALALGEKDLLTRLREFGDMGYGDGHFGVGDEFEVSMPKYDDHHDMVVYQCDERGSRL